MYGKEREEEAVSYINNFRNIRSNSDFNNFIFDCCGKNDFDRGISRRPFDGMCAHDRCDSLVYRLSVLRNTHAAKEAALGQCGCSDVCAYADVGKSIVFWHRVR